MKDFFYVPIFIEVTTLVFSIILCWLEWIMIEDDYFSSKFSSRLNLVICVVNEVATIAFIGQKLQDESSAVCDKIYNIDWNSLKNSNCKHYREMRSLIVITMMRAKRVEAISAGGILNFNCSTFTAVSSSIFH
jgi:hypothetical protein